MANRKVVLCGLSIGFLLVSIGCRSMQQVRETQHSGEVGTESWETGTHYVIDDVSVRAGEKLTIAPGAVVKFRPGMRLIVYGTIAAGQSVVFTSRDDDDNGEILQDSDHTPEPGDWGGLFIRDTGSCDGCRILYGSGDSEPTVIEIVAFSAKVVGQEALVKWETATEIGNVGFYLWRCKIPNGSNYIRVNENIIPSKGSPTMGAKYSYKDAVAGLGSVLYYKLQDIDGSGHSTFHGPVSTAPSGSPAGKP